jgi:hypothetical protein
LTLKTAISKCTAEELNPALREMNNCTGEGAGGEWDSNHWNRCEIRTNKLNGMTNT